LQPDLSIHQQLKFIAMYEVEKTDDRLFGLRGLSDYLGVSIPVASKLTQSGQFPVYRAGERKYLYKKSEVLAGLKKESPAPSN
jgi:hypothetical protein